MPASRVSRYAWLALALAVGMPASGQTVSGSIVGTVTDATGSVVPGAKITVTNAETRAVTKTTTNETGGYRAPFLPIGSYDVRVEAAGFQTVLHEAVPVRVDEAVRVDATLQVGNVQDQITITAAPPLLNTENASTGQIIENAQIMNLPLINRNFLSLTQLDADVNSGAAGTFSRNTLINPAQKGVSFSAAGQRDAASSFLVDGANVRGGYLGSITLVPSVDTIQEFRMQTAAFSAQFGTSPVHLNVATKSGTNAVHGSLWEFHREGFLNARSAFARRKGPYHHHQFGGTFGGPVDIPKLYHGANRTFFFFGYEGTRINVKGSSLPSMPPQAMREGDFSALLPGRVIKDPYTGQPFPGNIIPKGRLSPQALPLLVNLPLPTRDGLTRNYDGFSPSNNYGDDYVARVDHTISQNDKIYGRFGLTNPQNLGSVPGAGGNPLQVSQNYQRGQNYLVNETHTFGPRTFNEARFAYNRSTYLIGPVGAKDFGPTMNWGGVDHTLGAPLVSTNFALIRDQDPGGYTQRTYQMTDNVFLYRGKHSISSGVDIFRYMTDPTLPLGFDVPPPKIWSIFNGQYSGYAFADFLLGLPSSAYLFNNRAGYLSPPMSVRYPDINLYVQDDWKISPRFTFNMGLRYELVPVLSDGQGAMRNFNFQTGQLYPAPGTGDVKFYGGAHKNFAPRIGFAWQPFAGGKTVIRAGYGWFYSRTVNLGPTSLANNPPAASTVTVINPPGVPAVTLANVFNNTNPQVNSGGNISAIDPDYTATPATQIWSFDIQHQLPGAILLDVGYKGSISTHLDGQVDLNTALPGPGLVQPRRPYPDWAGIITNASVFTATYHSGILRVEKRMTGGLSLHASYAWSKTLDQTYSPAGDGGEAGAVGVPQDRTNLRAEKGRSSLDVNHRAVLSYVYQLPFGPGKRFLNFRNPFLSRVLGGWAVSGITTFATGFPITVRTLNDVSNTGTGQQRPDVLFDPVLPRGQRNADHWFRKEAFADPKTYRYGNAGRTLISNPGVNNFTLAGMKDTTIRESLRIQFRAEFLNAFNHPSLGTPDFQLGDDAFGTIGSAGARVIQLGLKLMF